MKSTENKDIRIEITAPDIKLYTLRLVGDTPLIVHNWSEKAKKQMLDAMQGKKQGKKKDLKDPVAEFIDSLFWITEKPEQRDEAGFEKAVKEGARFGFPAIAIKRCANATAYHKGWVKNQTGLRAAYFIRPEIGDLIEIHGDTPIMREDPVTVGIGGKDLRYRAEFVNWYMDVTIEYDESSMMYDIHSIVNAINHGGFSNGLGEWRPEKDGNFGRFHVETL